MPSLNIKTWTDCNCLDATGDTNFSPRSRRKSFPLEIRQRYSLDTNDRPTVTLNKCSSSHQKHDEYYSFNDLLRLNENSRNYNVTRNKCYGVTSWMNRRDTINIIGESSSSKSREYVTNNIRKSQWFVNHRVSNNRNINHRLLCVNNNKRFVSTKVAVTRRTTKVTEKRQRKRRKAKGLKRSKYSLRINRYDCCCTPAAVSTSFSCYCCTQLLSAEIRAPAVGNGRLRHRRRNPTASSPLLPPTAATAAATAATRSADRAARRLRRERRARCLGLTTVDSRRVRVVRGCCSKKVSFSVIVSPRRECRSRGAIKTTTVLAERRLREADGSACRQRATLIPINTRDNTKITGQTTYFNDLTNNSKHKKNDNILEDIIDNDDNDCLNNILIINCRELLNIRDNENTGNSSACSLALNTESVLTNEDPIIGEIQASDQLTNAKNYYYEPVEKINNFDDKFIDDIVLRIETLLRDNVCDWLKNETFRSDMKSKNCDKKPKDMTSDAIDPNEDTERYDEFNTVMVPVARTLSKSPQSDEGIEPDRERKKNPVTRCWSLDSANLGDEDTSRNQQHNERRRSKQKVTRCCSSDSAVLSDEEQVKGWENLILCDGVECESTEGRPRYWRTPSVVVSDYSDYSYLDEKYERSDPDLEKYEGGISGTPSQSSSCSCLDCDEIREFQDLTNSLDNHLLQVCGRRRHSDSCCTCLSSSGAITNGGINDPTNRRNSCLASPNPYRYNSCSNRLDSGNGNYTNNEQQPSNVNKTTIEFLSIPPFRKISDCSTNSSLSGDDFEVTELQPLKRPQSSGWRKLRNIVQWTPFFQTYKKQRYPWVQLAGHQGNFRAGPTPGTILKKLCPQEEACFRLLMRDVLRPYVPEFKGVLDVRESEDNHQDTDSTNVKEVEEDSQKGAIVASYLQLQDLLGDFEQPCVMDCKVGVRTYLESELAKAKERPKLRKDMYEKMIQVDPSAPNTEERRVQGVTKPRYMVWRETISSTATLGFRVEGIKLGHGGSSKDFKTTRSREQVTEALKRFVENYPHAVPKYLQRLKAIRATLKASPFFATHEVVGSSLLFVHDAKNAGVWMIDFAKTLPLPAHLPSIQHDADWQVGNHEDGYLIGVNNLIDIFQDIRNSET